MAYLVFFMSLPIASCSVRGQASCSDALILHALYRALSRHAISWKTLSSDRPLEAHLWVTFVQSGAKIQPAFRSYRNHYTRARNIRAARRRARGRDLLLPTHLRRADEVTHPHNLGRDLALHPRRGCSSFGDPGRGSRHTRARRRAARTPGRARPLNELTTPRRSASPPRWAKSRR